MLSISIDAGLPNITGSTSFLKFGTGQGTNGAIKTSLKAQKKDATSPGKYWAESNFVFDASLLNPEIYGDSDTVIPKSLTTFILMKY